MVNKVNNISTTDVINLVKKTDYNTKNNEIENKITTGHDKYITTQEHNKLLSEKLIFLQAKLIFLKILIL